MPGCTTTLGPSRLERGEGIDTMGKQTNRKMQAKREAAAKAQADKRHRAGLNERQERKERRDQHR
jgi:hypothetical protein